MHPCNPCSYYFQWSLKIMHRGFLCVSIVPRPRPISSEGRKRFFPSFLPFFFQSAICLKEQWNILYSFRSLPLSIPNPGFFKVWHVWRNTRCCSFSRFFPYFSSLPSVRFSIDDESFFFDPVHARGSFRSNKIDELTKCFPPISKGG